MPARLYSVYMLVSSPLRFTTALSIVLCYPHDTHAHTYPTTPPHPQRTSHPTPPYPTTPLTLSQSQLRKPIPVRPSAHPVRLSVPSSVPPSIYLSIYLERLNDISVQFSMPVRSISSDFRRVWTCMKRFFSFVCVSFFFLILSLVSLLVDLTWLWAPSRENLSSGFSTRWDSNRPAQL